MFDLHRHNPKGLQSFDNLSELARPHRALHWVARQREDLPENHIAPVLGLVH